MAPEFTAFTWKKSHLKNNFLFVRSQGPSLLKTHTLVRTRHQVDHIYSGDRSIPNAHTCQLHGDAPCFWGTSNWTNNFWGIWTFHQNLRKYFREVSQTPNTVCCRQGCVVETEEKWGGDPGYMKSKRFLWYVLRQNQRKNSHGPCLSAPWSGDLNGLFGLLKIDWATWISDSKITCWQGIQISTSRAGGQVHWLCFRTQIMPDISKEQNRIFSNSQCKKFKLANWKIGSILAVTWKWAYLIKGIHFVIFEGLSGQMGVVVFLTTNFSGFR